MPYEAPEVNYDNLEWATLSLETRMRLTDAFYATPTDLMDMLSLNPPLRPKDRAYLTPLVKEDCAACMAHIMEKEYYPEFSFSLCRDVIDACNYVPRMVS